MTVAAVDSVRARPGALWLVLGGGLAAAVLASLGVGRFPVPFHHVLGILGSHLLPIQPYWDETQQIVVELVRLPRILFAVFAGAGLATAGAALQGTFRNPLVGPQIIGVASGSAFGGALALLLGSGGAVLLGSAFAFGLVAMVIVFLLSRVGGRSPVLMLVLAGVITSAFFTALVSLLKFVADPEDTLPAIVFWLMGSLSTAGYAGLPWLAGPIALAAGALFLLRWRINLLSLGDEEAEAFGVPVARIRWVVVVAVALITAAVVAAAGIIGWVGLVVPHFARMVVGPDHRALLPASAILGGTYLLIIDDLARALTPAEIPLGVITAIIGAPVFAYLLRRTQVRGWSGD